MKNSPTADLSHFRLVWETPWVGFAFLLIALPLLAWGTWQLHRRGLTPLRLVILTTLRMIPFVVLALGLAQPLWVLGEEENGPAYITLLMDHSASMGLEDTGQMSRYQDSLTFARETVLPLFQNAGYKIQPVLFDASAEKANPAALMAAVPDGDGTDLGGAISFGLASTPRRPVAVVALTDGASNFPDSNRQAVAELLATKTPLIGIGFGSERGIQTLNLRQLEAPDLTPPKSKFRISARIEATVSGPVPDFNLVLLRDGKFYDRRRVPGPVASRFWSESFEVTEDEEGLHTYHVEIEPSAESELAVVNKSAKASVHVTKEEALRVLYLQGALTWDYKFIGKALRQDPTVHVTGLSRTSERSVFRQNVEAAGELIDGFPDDVKELAPFRAIILANLNPSQLSSQQQEAIASFCGNYGGGVLMIGGRGTFDASWRGSRLEQLLPVRFDEDRGVRGLDEPFHFRLTAEALNDPAFEIAEPGKNQDAWSKLPPFDDYGRVAGAKAGATVWAVHSRDTGPDGKPRILMASQSYGSGMSAVLTTQNFWRWRLAKDSEQSQFDRFWQQIIRRLAESSRQSVRIEVLDQELRPDRDISLTIERLAETATKEEKAPQEWHFRILTSQGDPVMDQPLTLPHGGSRPVTFRPEKADLYTLQVTDANEVILGTRVLEIRAPNLELQTTSRDMATLQQWALISDGSAWPVESIRQDPSAFAAAVHAQLEAARMAKLRREPAGWNLWTFLLVLAPLCANWVLRKRWMLA